MADENPRSLLPLCLVPRSLCMTRCECFYCGAPDTGMFEVHHMYGLKVCEQHSPLGRRDCNAYMHMKGLVTMYEMNDLFPELFLLLKNGFQVRRTNGAIESDWFVNPSKREQMKRSNTGEWMIPCVNMPAGKLFNDPIYKHVPLKEFLMDDILIKGASPSEYRDSIRGLIKALDEGVYKSDYNEHRYLFKEEYPDEDIIRSVIYEGRRIRMVEVEEDE